MRGTIGRPEFYTAYTPYQAEASQGTLQTIFEFQSMICALTGMDVANASLYDGATAAAEAMMLAVQATGRDRVAVSGAVHPETLRVLRTFAAGRAVGVDVIAPRGELTSVDDVRAALDERHAGLLVQQPTFFGTLETLADLAEAAHAVGALALCSADPLACAVLVPPGEAGLRRLRRRRSAAGRASVVRRARTSATWRCARRWCGACPGGWSASPPTTPGVARTR